MTTSNRIALFWAVVLVCSGGTGGATAGTPRADTARLLAAEFPVPDSASIQVDPNATVEELIGSARDMFVSDNHALSEMLYKSVLIRDPGNLNAMMELAVLYERTDRLHYARGLLARASIANPRDDEIIARLNQVNARLAAELQADVDSMMATGDHASAIPRLSMLLTTQPENSELHYKKAECYLALDQPEMAIAEMNMALNLDRNERFVAMKERATAARRTSEISRLKHHVADLSARADAAARSEALTALARILELEPNDVWAKRQFALLTDDQAIRRSTSSDWSRGVGAWISKTAASLRAFGRAIVSRIAERLELFFGVLIVLLVFASPLTHAIVRGFSPRRSLAGRLDLFSFQEVMSLINAHQCTGVLQVRSPQARGRMYFDKGEIYHASARKLQGNTALRHLMLNSKQGHFVFRDGVRTAETTIDIAFSLIMMDLPERKENFSARATLERQKKSKMSALLKTK